MNNEHLENESKDIKEVKTKSDYIEACDEFANDVGKFLNTSKNGHSLSGGIYITQENLESLYDTLQNHKWEVKIQLLRVLQRGFLPRQAYLLYDLLRGIKQKKKSVL